MTAAPVDLLSFRANAMQVTGLVGGKFGIAPDASHLAGGGYHVGVADVARIGKYHGPPDQHVGASTEDYSVRQRRDRREGTNVSSATDVGSTWRNGGRAAWLRWNNLLYAEMRDRPGNLPALRAINVSLDGGHQQRYDQLHRGDGLISSNDTVTTHTHLEFWRDTEGSRVPTLARIVQLMQAAIGGTTPAATGDDDMAGWNEPLGQGPTGEHYAKEYPATALAWIWKTADGLAASAAADEVRDKAVLAAIQALAIGSGADPKPIVDAVNAVRDEARTRFADLMTAVSKAEARAAAAEAEVVQLRAALHTSAQAEADATAAGT